jgi:UDP-N-acetylmuramyl pentapeptide synthase
MKTPELVYVQHILVNLNGRTRESALERARKVVQDAKSGEDVTKWDSKHSGEVAVEAARQAGLAESHHVTTFEDTVALLLKRLAPGDAVLVKGSRGMRMERVVDALVARFGGVSG